MEILFAKPLYLWLLVPIPIFAVIIFLALRRARHEIEKLISFHALEFLFKKGSFILIYIRKNLLVFMFRSTIYAFIVLAIAGSTVYYDGEAKEPAIVVSIDVSGSMLTEDIKPNRLDAVKETINTFLEKIPPKSKIAVLSFSGNAYIEQQLSSKNETMRSIDALEISTISGTSIGAALKTAANILNEEKNPKLIFLISDGAENILPKQALDEIIENINEQHITVNVIGIGQIKGAILPGTDLLSTLDESLLQDIAKKTGGIYFKAETKQELIKAYDTLASSTKLKIPIRLALPLIILAVLLLLVDYVFIRLN